MPRHPDPELENRILTAASRLWARGGEKKLTMRAVASAADTTTPTVYERYRDRADILRALRLKARSELFAALSPTRTLAGAVQGYLEFALDNPHGYGVLFDGVGKPPSLHEPWPSFNLMRQRLVEELGGTPRQHTRLMLAIWSLMHGTAMLIIRGGFEGALRTQAVHACLDTVQVIVRATARSKSFAHSGPKWPANLVLGEAERSSVGNGDQKKRGAERVSAGGDENFRLRVAQGRNAGSTSRAPSSALLRRPDFSGARSPSSHPRLRARTAESSDRLRIR